MRKNSLLIIALAITAVSASAQAPSGPASDSTARGDGFAYRRLIVPAVLVTVGQFGTWEPHAVKVNEAVRARAVRWRGECRVHADDYVQYLSLAAYAGLGNLGAAARHDWSDRLIVLGASYAAAGVVVNTLKYTVREKRPDSPARHSFPSGHTATAFLGAELIRREYGTGYGVAAYAVAAGIGVLRIYNDRHWLGDVVAGAGVGILCAEIGYRLLPYGRRLLGTDGGSRGPALAAVPSYDPVTRTGGLALYLSFGR